jgi:hypothetical protein
MHTLQSKKNKDQFNKEKEMKTEKKKEIFGGDLKGPPARRPYGPPSPHSTTASTLFKDNRRDDMNIDQDYSTNMTPCRCETLQHMVEERNIVCS